MKPPFLPLLSLASAAAAEYGVGAQKPMAPGSPSGVPAMKGDGNPLDADFAKFVERKLEEWHVPGVAIAVVDGDGVWGQGYGIASYPSTPATNETLWQVGSTTKAFTTSVLSRLIDDNLTVDDAGHPLSWQTPLARLLGGDFVTADAWATAHLTLEDAASHRSGLPRHDKALATHYGSGSDRRRRASVRDYTRALRHLPLVAEPRTVFRYCNYMFLVLSQAVETLARTRGGGGVGAAMRDRVWAPLGMDATFLGLAEARASGLRMAEGYRWEYLREGREEGGGGFTQLPPFEQLDLAAGAGGVMSHVLDYARWMRCLLLSGAAPPLSPQALEQLVLARTPMPADSRLGFDAPTAYALGWVVGTYRGRRVWSHSGGMEGFGTELYLFPDLGYGVVTMANTGATANALGLEMLWRLVNEKMGVPEGERWDWGRHYHDIFDKQLSPPKSAVEELYPERARPAFPPRLLLTDYAGTYFHPAYRNLTVEMQGSGATAGLEAARADFMWPMRYTFEHASGEYWAVVITDLNGSNGLDRQLAKAEFKLGVSGRVEALQVEHLEQGSEGVVVFDRVA
ncbi:beta-lactamase/transpeptidase-like protein [Xylariomycetidae sp. FL0641]|nr:beta-lactamase/transpeptidase-like protein [Xylariomycetidae sp. FL0641]